MKKDFTNWSYWNFLTWRKIKSKISAGRNSVYRRKSCITGIYCLNILKWRTESQKNKGIQHPVSLLSHDLHHVLHCCAPHVSVNINSYSIRISYVNFSRLLALHWRWRGRKIKNALVNFVWIGLFYHYWRLEKILLLQKKFTAH